MKEEWFNSPSHLLITFTSLLTYTLRVQSRKIPRDEPYYRSPKISFHILSYFG